MKCQVVVLLLVVMVLISSNVEARRRPSRQRGGGGGAGTLVGGATLALKTALGLGALGTAATVGGIVGASALGLGGIGTITSISLAGLTFGKRSVGDVDSLAVAVHYFDMAMELDPDFCVPLIFCEAAVKGQSPQATKFETDVNKLAENAFRRVGAGFTARTLGELVVYATMLGSRSKSDNICKQEFPKCENASPDYIENVYNNV